ncbi:MAG: tRNA (adenosine(37)-N6)-dimethylallyltransferase MiaA [Actinomycetota bacterium]|nr:tRNA (adenosine(37)-N6)-dimethylallyltransferase MiaA [Actinomycetota bacterium]
MPERARVRALVGPTAVGKTEVSLAVAQAIDAEIVSVDSMQAYRGMDVGTAKASPAQRTSVPHHLVDVFDPSEEVTVAQFQALARAAIDDISKRGRVPLLVGGSGLYFRSVVDDLRFPPRSETLRTSLAKEAEDVGAETLHARLRELDPAAAAKMEPGNARRIIRALEVIELTGRPFSDNDTWERFESRYDLRVAGLELPREVLYDRIAARIDRMLQEGLLSEVAALKQSGFGRTAGQALGYRQALEAAPDSTLAGLRDDIVRATKRFARRQESWFRADPRVRWFDAEDPELTARLVRYFEDSER